MIDPELKKYLDSIYRNISSINKKTAGIWGSFVRGILGGAGSVVGVAIALLLVVWLLNVLGVIPYFKDQVENFRQALEEIKRVR